MGAQHVADELIEAALRLSRDRRQPVAEIPVATIAAATGVSRSTLLRRLGGSRAPLDEAIRARGIDPGGEPVRVKALVAAGELIAELGLAATTMEVIARRADCSVDSLYLNFGSREELLAAVFERYSPILDIDDILSSSTGDFSETVRRVYREVITSLSRQPRVTPALLAEVMARPAGTVAKSIAQRNAPRVFGVLGSWLDKEVSSGRIRDLPLPILLNLFVAPVAANILLGPAIASEEREIDMDELCDIFAEAFIRGTATGGS